MKTRSAVMRLITNQKRQVIASLILAVSFCRLPTKCSYRMIKKKNKIKTMRLYNRYIFWLNLNTFFVLFFFFLFFRKKGLIDIFKYITARHLKFKMKLEECKYGVP